MKLNKLNKIDEAWNSANSLSDWIFGYPKSLLPWQHDITTSPLCWGLNLDASIWDNNIEEKNSKKYMELIVLNIMAITINASILSFFF